MKFLVCIIALVLNAPAFALDLADLDPAKVTITSHVGANGDEFEPFTNSVRIQFEGKTIYSLDEKGYENVDQFESSVLFVQAVLREAALLKKTIGIDTSEDAPAKAVSINGISSISKLSEGSPGFVALSNRLSVVRTEVGEDKWTVEVRVDQEIPVIRLRLNSKLSRDAERNLKDAIQDAERRARPARLNPAYIKNPEDFISEDGF